MEFLIALVAIACVAYVAISHDRHINSLYRKIADLEQRCANMERTGSVEDRR